MSANHASTEKPDAPQVATAAVLKPSEDMPEGARKVKGFEFDGHEKEEVTVSELINGMANMGFQASALADAVRIINDMVSIKIYLIQHWILDSKDSKEEMARSGDWRQDYHIPWIHLKYDLFRPERNF